MKVIAFNGSPKKEGNTYHALRILADTLEKDGIEVEIIHVGNKVIRGCMSCNACAKNRDQQCIMKEDSVNEWIGKMKEADGIIISSPVHFSAIAGTMKSFLDRAFYVASVNKNMFRHKVGAAVVAVRRSGGIPTFNQLNNFLSYSEMMMASSNYWSVGHGTKPGELLEDEEGVQIMSVLGENMAYMLKMREASNVEAPEWRRKVFTNFIR